jgi:ribosomal protein S18 acetylase RimI-like enzyme
MEINLRAICSGDENFLFTVYASTREDEMRLVDWDPTQKKSFLEMQFNAQTSYYQENYPGAQFQIILLEDHPIGRLYLHSRKDEIRIMDITLLPEYRNRGIGSALLNEILGEAQKNNSCVTIHVERYNPALLLYERLGFRLAEDKGVYHFMKWSPEKLEQYDLVR